MCRAPGHPATRDIHAVLLAGRLLDGEELAHMLTATEAARAEVGGDQAG